MAKKPILTSDDTTGGGPARAPFVPPVPPVPPALPSTTTPVGTTPVGATRPVDPPAAPQSPQPTRPVGASPTHQTPANPPSTPPPATNQPSAGRDASGHVRPKTRILGYGAAPEAPQSAEIAPETDPAVGWLVVTRGPGRGAALTLSNGMNGIGRGEDCTQQLDFGDDAISREAHAYVTYDNEARRFFVSHGGKTNLVRLNDAPVLATEPLAPGDTLRIGATSLRFVALCGPDFDWSDP